MYMYVCIKTKEIIQLTYHEHKMLLITIKT